MSEQKLFYHDVTKSGLANFLAISDHFMKKLFSFDPTPDSLTDVTFSEPVKNVLADFAC